MVIKNTDDKGSNKWAWERPLLDKQCIQIMINLLCSCIVFLVLYLQTCIMLMTKYITETFDWIFPFYIFLTATQLKFQNTDIFNFLLHFIYLIHTSRITILQTKHANLIKSWIVDGLNHPKLGEYLNFWLPHTTKSPFIHITAWTIVIQYNNMTLPV